MILPEVEKNSYMDSVSELISHDYDKDLLIALLNSSTDQIYFKDLHGRYIKVSETYAKKYGHEAKDLIGKTDFDLLKPIQAERALIEEKNIIRSGNPIIGKEEYEDSLGGKKSWLATSKIPLYDSNRKIIGTLGITKDITRKKRDEQIKGTLLQIINAVYNYSDVNILYKKIHQIIGNLIPANNFIIALFDEKNKTFSYPYFVDEYESHRIPGQLEKGLIEFILKTGKTELIDSVRFNELKTRGEIIEENIKNVIWLGIPLKVSERPFGAIILHEYLNINVYDDDDINVLKFAADQIAQAIQKQIIPDKVKQYVEELQISNNNKDKFLSIISHDLRSPINGLISFSELLLDNFSSQRENEKELFIKNLQSNLKNLLSLTENLLTWARIQSKGIKIEKRKLNLSNLIHSVLETQSIVARNKGILLESICSKDKKVFADQNMLETVIRNLVSNSIKFTKRDGSVRVVAEENESNIIVKIQDTGVGMSEEIVKDLFKIDTKVSREGTQMEKGTGLGLVICKEFIEINGGNLFVQSMPGVGTTMIITLERYHS